LRSHPSGRTRRITSCTTPSAATIGCKQAFGLSRHVADIPCLRSRACTRLSRTASISTAISDG
jgi:hypothetical protein